ncbi:MAG: hypothetical protein ACKO1M_10100, partial [Planctomycetota bacterium]
MATLLACRPVSRSIIGLALLATLIAPPLATAEEPGNEPTGTIEGHPALSRSPRHTTTSRGHQGDAVNVAFIGT